MALIRYYLVCKGCKTPIQLPHPNLPKRRTNQATWPKGNWNATFGCRMCGYVSNYTALDVRWHPVHTPALSQQRVGETDAPLFVLYVTIEYGEQTLPIQARIHSSWHELTTTAKNQEILALWKSQVANQVGQSARYVSGFVADRNWWK